MVQIYSKKPKVKPQPIYITLDIDNLNQSGEGVGRYKGKVTFVKGALPHEHVKARVIQDKKNIIQAEVVKVIKASSERVVPACEHFNDCGGCHLQHLSENAQLVYKQEMVQALFIKAGWEGALNWVEPIQYHPFNYRSRARLACYYDRRADKLELGFRAKNSKKIVNIKQCPVLATSLNELIIELNQLLNGLNGKKYLGHVDLNNMSSDTIVKVYTINELPVIDIEALIDFAKQQSITLVTQVKGAEEIYHHGIKELTYTLDNVNINFTLNDFTQVNAKINAAMVSQAISWLNINKSDHVLDLFCGLGNFSLPIALQAKRVVGIEGIQSMVTKAQNNALNNQIENIEFIQSDLDSPSENHFEQPSKIILDPARSGAESVCKLATNWQASHVLYISCNPDSLARDGKHLLDAGYTIEKICLLDMFPQTSHIETMALFIKR